MPKAERIVYIVRLNLGVLGSPWCNQMDPHIGPTKAERPARTYIQQLCEDTACSPEDLPEAMNDREKWRESVRDIRASGNDMMMMMNIV